MAKKVLEIKISGSDLADLKNSDYSLCLAKKVEGYPFNVVWHAYDTFFASNSFSWTSAYELFASNAFVPGSVVKETVTPVKIRLGEQSTLDAKGILSPAAPGGAPAALTMNNNFGSIHPGLRQSATGLDQKESSAANFVTEKPALMGATDLVPVESIMVWFAQDIKTGTQFNRRPPVQADLSTMVSFTYAIIVDFTQADEQTISYQQQKWSLGGL